MDAKQKRSELLAGCKAAVTTEIMVQRSCLITALGQAQTDVLVGLGKPSKFTDEKRPLRPMSMLTIDRLMLIEALEGTMPELQDTPPKTESILGVDEVE